MHGDNLNKSDNSFNIQVCNVGLAAEAAKFFPDGHAVSGTFNEVSCKQWSGSDGPAAFKGACLAGETAPDWPAVGCGNQGSLCFPSLFLRR